MSLPRLLVAVALAVVGAASAPPSLGQIAVLGSLADDRDALPGSKYAGQIRVVNDSKAPMQAKVYQTDYAFQYDGSNFFHEPGSDERSNATWIRFNPSILNVPPGETMPIDYEVTVPDTTAGLNGSYWSMIMVEGIGPDSPESTIGQPNRGEIAVRQIIRYGFQIATHVRTEEVYNVAFGDLDLVDSVDGKVVQAPIENTGNLLIEPKVWVEVYDADGEVVGKFEGSVDRIYPGTSVTQSMNVGHLPGGSYEALLVVDAGSENIFGAQFSIRI